MADQAVSASDGRLLQQLVGHPSSTASQATFSMVTFRARQCAVPNYFRDATRVRPPIKLAPPCPT